MVLHVQYGENSVDLDWVESAWTKCFVLDRCLKGMLHMRKMCFIQLLYGFGKGMYGINVHMVWVYAT